MVSRRSPQLYGLMLSLSLLTPTMAYGDPFLPVGGGAEFVTGIDHGVGPGWSSSTSPNLNSVVAAAHFHNALGADATSTTVDFGSTFSSWNLKSNNNWTSDVDTPGFSGLKAMTTGIDYTPPPAPYQYGITSVTDPVGSNAFIGYGVDGPSHFEFVSGVSESHSSLTIHSDTAFEAFGFYVTGLGNTGGIVDIALDGVQVSALTLTGASDGGVLFLGYIGNVPIHDLTFSMTNGAGGSRDVFGISKIELVSVPEPSSLVHAAIYSAGLIGVVLIRMRRPSAHR